MQALFFWYSKLEHFVSEMQNNEGYFGYELLGEHNSFCVYDQQFSSSVDRAQLFFLFFCFSFLDCSFGYYWSSLAVTFVSNPAGINSFSPHQNFTDMICSEFRNTIIEFYRTSKICMTADFNYQGWIVFQKGGYKF